ncbi:MAG TPA: heme o synthase [Longimicrobiales bacterium]|nr:heme o synthase [Longimicrobiales bacterium]
MIVSEADDRIAVSPPMADAARTSAPTTSPSQRATVQARPRLGERIGAYIELTKPGIVRMVMVTAGAGYFMASGLGHPLDMWLLLHTLLGIGLAAAGACGLNEYAEWEADGRMRRTEDRPVPSGRMTPRTALWFSTALVFMGLTHLQLFAGSLTAALVALTVVTYVFIYTPMKRYTWTATLVGAIPGALPILAGWTAGGGGLSRPGLALFAILFLWQMPHFYALAWIYRDDYRRGGFRMLTTMDPDGSRTGRQIVLFALVLLPVSVLPSLLGLTGALYLVAAAALGIAFLGLGVAMAARPDDRRAMRLFLGSVAYLPLLLLVMVVDRLIT